ASPLSRRTRARGRYCFSASWTSTNSSLGCATISVMTWLRPSRIASATPRALELLALAVEMQLLLLRQALERAVGDHLVHFLQALDRLLHGLEVREHSAQPAVVDVRRARAPRLFLDDLARLALGAHEEDGPLVGG